MSERAKPTRWAPIYAAMIAKEKRMRECYLALNGIEDPRMWIDEVGSLIAYLRGCVCFECETSYEEEQDEPCGACSEVRLRLDGIAAAKKGVPCDGNAKD